MKLVAYLSNGPISTFSLNSWDERFIFQACIGDPDANLKAAVAMAAFSGGGKKLRKMPCLEILQHVLAILCSMDVVLERIYSSTSVCGHKKLKLLHVISEDSIFFLLCFLVNSNRVTGIYELSLCKMADTGSPGKQFQEYLY